MKKMLKTNIYYRLKYNHSLCILGEKSIWVHWMNKYYAVSNAYMTVVPSFFPSKWLRIVEFDTWQPTVKCQLFPVTVHTFCTWAKMLVEIICMQNVYIINENKYHKRLTIKSLQFLTNWFGVWIIRDSSKSHPLFFMQKCFLNRRE